MTIENTLIYDLEIPYVTKRHFFRKVNRAKTELLGDKLNELGFSLEFTCGNTLYHGLQSVDILESILQAKAVLGPKLLENYNETQRVGETYEFPEQKFRIGNPPDYGEFAGFTNFNHAMHVAALGFSTPEEVFNKGETILLGFNGNLMMPIISLNYMKIEDTDNGLGVLIAPSHLKSRIETLIKENYSDPKFKRIYVSIEESNKKK